LHSIPGRVSRSTPWIVIAFVAAKIVAHAAVGSDSRLRMPRRGPHSCEVRGCRSSRRHRARFRPARVPFPPLVEQRLRELLLASVGSALASCEVPPNGRVVIPPTRAHHVTRQRRATCRRTKRPARAPHHARGSTRHCRTADMATSPSKQGGRASDALPAGSVCVCWSVEPVDGENQSSVQLPAWSAPMPSAVPPPLA
jgi:hypothetical protein